MPRTASRRLAGRKFRARITLERRSEATPGLDITLFCVMTRVIQDRPNGPCEAPEQAQAMEMRRVVRQRHPHQQPAAVSWKEAQV